MSGGPRAAWVARSGLRTGWVAYGVAAAVRPTTAILKELNAVVTTMLMGFFDFLSAPLDFIARRRACRIAAQTLHFKSWAVVHCGRHVVLGARC